MRFVPAAAGPPVDPTTGTVTVPADTTTATVTATNWFLTGAIDVTKVWTGDADAITKFGTDPALFYEFTLICTRDGLDVTLLGGNTRDVNSTSPVAIYTGIASGADCVITETDNGGALATGFRINDLTGSLTARVNGDAATLAPLRPVGEVENHAEFINTYVLPVTGVGDNSWLVVSGTLLLGGVAMVLVVSLRRRQDARTA